MESKDIQRSSRPVATWLLVGVGMLIIQVLLGGITRLTGAGLSITEWKPIMGVLPPMNEQDWNTAFEKYKQIAQYKYLNSHFTLGEFKFIFFWEWLHRVWARLIGVAFIIPFVVFLVQRRIKKEMIKPLLILFLLGGLQGLVGWIMVKSGLEDSALLYVSHYKLAIHFVLALGVLCYTLWFAMQLLVPKENLVLNKRFHSFMSWLTGLLVIQLIYGAFMAGLKAASAAPTWPLINGEWLPGNIHSYGNRQFNGLSFLSDNPLVVHFIHRNLAFIVTVLIGIGWWKARRMSGSVLFNQLKNIPMIIVFVQVIVGILTVMQASNSRAFLWLGVAHQFNAMLLLLSLTGLLYIVRRKAYF
ncbi:MAG TPA: COX15/CtaA family protein [Chitinophagaceae bacterium]|nr:COX15/CtaA family protein [Chitinophagaceae bacterium]